MRPDPLEEALEALERGRRERLIVVAVVILALAAAVVVGLAAAGGTSWPTASAVAAVALVVVVSAHVISLVLRERRSVLATRALLAARADRAADEARERVLGASHVAARTVSASLDLAAVVDRAVQAATTLVEATDAELLLRTGDQLAVAAAVGRDAPPRGTRRALTSTDRSVLEGGETLAGGRGGDWGSGPATITAPVALPDRVVGTLVVRRGPDARPFGESDRLAIALLAEQVALALRNATAHDRERQRSEAFRNLIGVALDGPDDPVSSSRR